MLAVGDIVLVTKWFHVAGKSLTELTLRDFDDADPLSYVMMMRALERNCLSLHVLNVSACDRQDIIVQFWRGQAAVFMSSLHPQWMSTPVNVILAVCESFI